MFWYSAIDRQGQIRTDDAAVQQLWQSPQSRTLLWHAGEFVMQSNKPRLFSYHGLKQFNDSINQTVYLGKHEEIDYFVCQIEQPNRYFDQSEMMTLRRASRMVSADHQSLMFYAQGLCNWLQNHGYCSRCGSEMSVISAGHARKCKNEGCGKVSYPKIDPAVIFSIINNTEGESRILLGRQAVWEENRYSVIAGFVEPGETLEDAVRREAEEETGLQVEDVFYIASQAWPFPDSLMLGFSCEAKQQEIKLVDQELETAAWFSASEIEQKLKAGKIKMPFDVSISWHLIDRWFKNQKGYSIKQL